MSAATPLVIIGCGGNSQDVVDLVRDINAAAPAPRFQCLGFLDDDPALAGSAVLGLPVLGPLQSINDHQGAGAVFMVGSPASYRKRRSIFEALGAACEFPSLVHPSAVVSPSAAIGRGTVVFPHVTIGSNARIGEHVMILPGSVVSHHSTLGDFTCVASNATICGGCAIGAECYLGAGCCIRERVAVHDRALVGMAACVLEDVPPDSRVAGNPAREL